jgi:hypothetical protein
MAWQGASGIISRPALPTAGKASCQAIIIKRSGGDIATAYRDLRANDIYGNIAPGDTAVYATSGPAAEMYRAADGSARQFTTDNGQTGPSAGNTIFAGLSSYYQGVDGQPHLGGEWRHYAPYGGFWQDPTGWHLRTWHGVKIDAGGLVLPSPFGAKVATYTIQCDVFSANAGVVVLGPPTGAQPVVQAISLQALMTAFAADVATFTQAISTFASGLATATPAASGACATLTAGAEAFAAATTALMSTITALTGAKSTSAS